MPKSSSNVASFSKTGHWVFDVQFQSYLSQVNWTDEASLELFEQNKLPDIPVPKNVADVRFFQVMFNSEKSVEFTFKIK